MPQYRYVGDVANTVVAGERTIPVGPGDFVDLTDEEYSSEDNETLRSNNALLEVTGAAKASTSGKLKSVPKNEDEEVND